MDIFKPIISLDIETTGLKGCNPYVLEFGAVYDDFGLSSKPTLEINFLIDNGDLDPKRTEEYAMDLNKEILQQIADKKSPLPIYTLDEAKKKIREFIQEAHYRAYKDTDMFLNPTRTRENIVPVLGKNVASFDMPILDKNGLLTEKEFSSLIGYRYLDLGSIFHGEFKNIPSLGEISKRYGLHAVDHRALSDAYLCLDLYKKKFGLC